MQILTVPPRVEPSRGRGDVAAGGPALAVHGGAGARRTELSLEQSGDYESGLRAALDAGAAVLQEGGSALDAVCAAVAQLEDDPLFNAGRGASLTAAGTAELDASVMTGEGRAGAVAVSRHARNPVFAARAVLERTEHVLIVSPGEEVVRGWGLATVEPGYFVTDQRRRQLEDVLARRQVASRSGTVGAVALDRDGRLAAATSTGGMVGQDVGRVGDSPIIGAGTFARARTVALSCTGDGEAYVEGAVAHEIDARLRHTGCSLEEALAGTYADELDRRAATGGTIGVTGDGELVLGYNSEGMFRGYWDGQESRVFT
ncbi:MAG TPA: isoaspartyl peptidase/L-asparaginase [Segeticoccus sp.]|uniref:isoaspartyl peptidase/L-asparaginase family protein n=1 Tax=Segeticoccus sp. TaxID=2706531 RepID=UPI002D7E78D9|nr:isoaspartyl peptidase/L-asparaginase [Segeticoccus sp.]HET8601699.1 isoaspartyl peptidase/L-asparaginase [Segeticoccus sp.]